MFNNLGAKRKPLRGITSYQSPITIYAKQTQFLGVRMNVNDFSQKDYENKSRLRTRKNKPKQSQFSSFRIFAPNLLSLIHLYRFLFIFQPHQVSIFAIIHHIFPHDFIFTNSIFLPIFTPQPSISNQPLTEAIFTSKIIGYG